MDHSRPGLPVHLNSQSLPKLISTESVMPSNHLILCHPLLLPPSIFPSIRVFSNEPVLHVRWPKYWSFSFSISPSSEYSGLISFMMDWIDFLVVQGTLKSLLQHHSLKASVIVLMLIRKGRKVHSCPTLCNAMDCSTPGFPVYHQLLELAQTYVHQVSNAIQPSHPLSSPSPPGFKLAQSL